MKRMEKHCAASYNTRKTKKNTTKDELFENMNSHHRNIKLTVETNPIRFLDTIFNVNPDGSVTTKVFHRTWRIYSLWKLSNT